jgi:hypothetical protein
VDEPLPPTAGCPPNVAEFAGQTVAYVERALGVRLAYDSETLPVLDHYLRGVPTDRSEAVVLVAATSGAYFGEVVRRHLGGRWDVTAADPLGWRFILPTALSFTPGQLVLAAISRSDVDGAAEIDLPDLLRPILEDTLAAMGEVTEDVYYSLCGRLDTLEHLHEVVAAMAASKLAERAGAEPESEPDA